MFKSFARYASAIVLLLSAAQLNAQDHADHGEHSTTTEETHATTEDHGHEAHAVEMHEDHGHEAAQASEGHAEEASSDDEINITDLIMHHISDSHEWHFFDIDGHPYSLALPIIVYTDNGVSMFSSSVFHHNDNGEVVYDAGNGDRFVKVHDHIYLASEHEHHGAYVEHGEEHEVLNAKPTLDLSITKNVINMLLGAVIMLLLFLGVTRKYDNGVPRGKASFIEPLVVFVRDEIALQNIGKKDYQRFTPYLLTLFFFIWINNILGLFPGGANLTGNIAFTMTLAFLTLIIVNVNGKKDYWLHILWMPGVPVWVRIMLAPIELVGVLTKPFALMIRLFANMTAGHIVILSLISLTFIFKSLAIAPAAVGLTLFIYVIKVLVAFLQAYIFALLTALFIGQAVEEHDHH